MMKFLIGLILLIAATCSYSQQTINGSITHGGVQRTYILYVPATYSAANPAPLVFNFHGYTSNANAQIFYGEFRAIADTAGFLLVVPQGTIDGNGNTYWNAGWLGSTDDVGFTSALIDSIAADYNVNQDKVYSTGMSNGGYMSYYLACNLSDRIAAIASVTGAMTKGTPNTCNPQHPTPIMEIHGDADATVPYNGNTISESVQTGLNYWVNYNNANTTPTVATLPNVSTTDNSTVEHYIYANGDSCVAVEHYKILSGGHTWPGAPVNTGSGNTNHDINASKLIWEFFLQYDINGKINCIPTTVTNIENDDFNVNIYPNPANSFLKIDWEGNRNITSIRIKNILGEEVLSFDVGNQNQLKISTQKLSKGLYVSELLNGFEVIESKKVLVK